MKNKITNNGTVLLEAVNNFIKIEFESEIGEL